MNELETLLAMRAEIAAELVSFEGELSAAKASLAEAEAAMAPIIEARDRLHASLEPTLKLALSTFGAVSASILRRMGPPVEEARHAARAVASAQQCVANVKWVIQDRTEAMSLLARRIEELEEQAEAVADEHETDLAP